MKTEFLLVQLSAFLLIEHFSREFGLDAILWYRSAEYNTAQGCKKWLSVDVRPTQNVFALQACY